MKFLVVRGMKEMSYLLVWRCNVPFLLHASTFLKYSEEFLAEE